ncbi:MAG: hypothetical protein K2I52_02485 [Muribaculaceae bacterium]|nr:hypothetical protein [Muribaculaceae bacterium]
MRHHADGGKKTHPLPLIMALRLLLFHPLPDSLLKLPDRQTPEIIKTHTHAPQGHSDYLLGSGRAVVFTVSFFLTSTCVCTVMSLPNSATSTSVMTSAISRGVSYGNSTPTRLLAARIVAHVLDYSLVKDLTDNKSKHGEQRSTIGRSAFNIYSFYRERQSDKSNRLLNIIGEQILPEGRYYPLFTFVNSNGIHINMESEDDDYMIFRVFNLNLHE